MLLRIFFCTSKQTVFLRYLLHYYLFVTSGAFYSWESEPNPFGEPLDDHFSLNGCCFVVELEILATLGSAKCLALPQTSMLH